MSRRPDEWSYGPFEPGASPQDRTVVLPPGGQPGQGRGGPGGPGYPGYSDYPGYEARLPPRPPPRPRRRWGRRFLALLFVLLLAVVGLAVVADRRLDRVAALPDYRGRPAATPGTDWLIVGSDSREGLSAAEQKRLATGDVAGRRTDTIMLLHIPKGGGQPVLISLPRDSYVPIPGHDRQKLNAAFAFGGPQLLARTVENVTGIRLDHYMEIGFGGFAELVDAVGGVRICVDKAINDPKAGLNVKAGCQVMNSRKALGYVRTRATAQGDLDRVERQQQFVGALIDKVSSPGTLLNPMRSVPLLLDGSSALTVGQNDHVHQLASLGLAMRDISRGDGVKGTVPIAGPQRVQGVGDVLLWDRTKALALFDALKNDRAAAGFVEQKPKI